MVSLQHVFADTLRSVAVVVASILAMFVQGITPEEADATAAVVVSLIILFSLIPLIHGLIRTQMELVAIRKEEATEQESPKPEKLSAASAVAESSIELT